MYPPVVTKNPRAVEAEVQAAHLALFPQDDSQTVPQAFGWAADCFSGRYADYQAVDAGYHDFEHTLQGTLCFARLLLGRHRAGVEPALTPRMFQLGLLAILFHDTGYLKKHGDNLGTGAKYTVTHVDRSAEFAANYLRERGFTSPEIKSVQNMIRCTGLDANLSLIPFQSDLERILGFALSTADMLGQMAAVDYVDKLPVLYAEFVEAAAHAPDKTHFVAVFSSARDLMEKTPLFWKNYVQGKLNGEFSGLHHFLRLPYPDGPNWYLDQIEANMQRLDQRLQTGAPAA